MKAEFNQAELDMLYAAISRIPRPKTDKAWYRLCDKVLALKTAPDRQMLEVRGILSKASAPLDEQTLFDRARRRNPYMQSLEDWHQHVIAPLLERNLITLTADGFTLTYRQCELYIGQINADKFEDAASVLADYAPETATRLWLDVQTWRTLNMFDDDAPIPGTEDDTL